MSSPKHLGSQILGLFGIDVVSAWFTTGSLSVRLLAEDLGEDLARRFGGLTGDET